MDLRRLKCFIAVAEDLHFGRAAERVHLSQPAVSLQIKSLEDELGVQLFSRTNRRVSLTHAGAVFFNEAKGLLEHTEAVLNSIRELDSEGPDKLIIGSTAPAIYSLAPAIVTALREYLPGTEVRMSVLSTEQQGEALLDGKIHAGLVHPPMSHKTISLLPVGSAKIVLALSARHPLAACKSLSFSSLRDEKLGGFKSEAQQGVNEWKLRLSKRLRAYVRRPRMGNEMHG
jgi:DNA-binding transcriptional LysR family regulator